MAQGVTSLKKIIYLALALYAVAFVMPGAITALASQTFTSANPAVVAIFTVMITLVCGFVIVLLFIDSVRGS